MCGQFITLLWPLTCWTICPINPHMGTLKLQSNGPLYSNTVIGTLAVDGWAVIFGTARRGLVGCGPAQSPPCCTKCNRQPINGQCTNFIIRCGTVLKYCLWILKSSADIHSHYTRSTRYRAFCALVPRTHRFLWYDTIGWFYYLRAVKANM